MTQKCSLRFNQTHSCLLATSKTGELAVYNCDPFDNCYTSDINEGTISFAEMLFATSLVATVGPLNINNTLRIINTRKNTCICELNYKNSILDVRMNRRRLIVVFLTHILIYDVSCMKLIQRINILTNNKSKDNDKNNNNNNNNNNTNSNDESLICALSASNSSVLAYQQIPSKSHGYSDEEDEYGEDDEEGEMGIDVSRSNDEFNDDSDVSTVYSRNNNDNKSKHQTGSMIVFDTIKMQPISIINCHKNALAVCALSNNGVLLATASIKGTLVRIFNTRTSKKILEFRRGSLPARIQSMSFNNDNTILGCSSNKGTLHFFSIPNNIAELGVSNDSDVDMMYSSTQSDDSIDNSQHYEFPKASTLTTDELEEVRNLIDRADNTSNKAQKSSDKSHSKARQISSLLWNRYKQYLPDTINSLVEPLRDFSCIKLSSKNNELVKIGIVDRTCYVVTSSGKLLQYTIPKPIQGKDQSSQNSTGLQNCIFVTESQF